ncbi:MAG: hypothetical protein M1816_000565 [Peltula sp. TS41687]|nr:MAG: hypothetical protein M1816_000565 [Peltula sp. TS41687]
MNAEQRQPETEEGLPGKRPRRAGWLSLFNFTSKHHTPTLTIALILSVISGIVIPAVSIFLGRIFNLFTDYAIGKITGHVLVHKVSINCIALVAIGVGSWALNGGYFMFWLVFGELQAKSVRDRLFDGLMQKDMEWYDMRKNGVSALIPRLQSQIRELQMATSQPLGFSIQYTVTAFAALGVAFYHSWKLTLVIIATFPFAAIVLSFISAKMQPSINGQEECLSQASKSSGNAISAIETVKCFNGQEHEVKQYATMIRKATRYYLVQANANALQIGFVRLITLGMFVQGFWYGSTLIGHSTTSGQVVTTFWAALMATQAIEQLLPQMIVLEKGRAAGATLKAIIFRVERGRRITEMVGSQVPADCKGDIDIRAVSFSYPTRPDQLALDKATFFFPAGETVFVVGGSGSGKKHARKSHYAILFELGRKYFVQQQSTLFDESILRNIAFGRKDHEQVSRDEVKGACQAALLESTINDLPDGIETLVGNGGISLSGGQKQRLAIARARLRDTPIMILDESTSALDYVSRSLVMDAIREWRQGRTTIIITHDISQIFEDDYVYVMDKGKVVQEGYKKTLENESTGLFSSFMQARRGSTSPTERVNKRTFTNEEPTDRSRSDGSIPYTDRKFSTSTDSLDIEFPQNVQYIPTVFGGTSMDLRFRRPSQNLLSPVAALASPLSPRMGLPKGMEIIELAGRTTLANRQAAERGNPRKAYTKILSPDRVSRYMQPRTGFQEGFKLRQRKKSKIDRQKQIAGLKQILGTVWPNLDFTARGILVWGFICALIHAAATPVFSFLFAKLLSTFFLQTGRSKEALKWSLAVLGVAVGDATASYLMHFLFEVCGQAWIDRLRIEAFKRIMEQPRAWFDQEKNNVSRLAEYLDRNAEEMRNLVGRFVGFVFVATTMTLMAIVWSFIVCWKLTIVGLASAPVMYVITTGFESVSGTWEGKSNDAAEIAGAVFMETFSNIRVVRALTLEGFFRKKYAIATRDTLAVGLKRSAYSGLFYGLSDSGILFITALIFYYGAVLVSNREFSTSDILTVFTMLTFSIANANSIISFVPQINSSRDTATRLLRLAHLTSSSHEKTGSQRPTTVLPITFQNLTYKYSPQSNQLNLDEINLSIKPGSSTAIVGASGSGKSTLASIILKLYPILDSSSLTYNSCPSSHLHTSYLRSQIAIVSQTPSIFPTSISANISYGLPRGSCTIEEITHAAQRAGIHEFISSLPQTYATIIGEGGQGLSGGQAQRVAIARALVRRPQLLILDEATSSLDAESARLIRDTVKGIIQGNHREDKERAMAVLIITHSKEMMTVAENIVVLDRGRVVEAGAWDELMRKRGELRRLVNGGEWEM